MAGAGIGRAEERDLVFGTPSFRCADCGRTVKTAGGYPAQWRIVQSTPTATAKLVCGQCAEGYRPTQFP